MDDQTIKNSKRENAFGNKVLYDMCKNNPLHKINDVISGKVWLIGRSYAVAIERVREKKYINDDFYGEMVPKIFNEYYANFDDEVNDVKENDINGILSVHRKLTDAIKKVTGLEKRIIQFKISTFSPPGYFLYL